MKIDWQRFAGKWREWFMDMMFQRNEAVEQQDVMAQQLEIVNRQADEALEQRDVEREKYKRMLEQRGIYFDLYHKTHGKLRGTEMMLDARSYWLTETKEERDEARKWARYYKRNFDALWLHTVAVNTRLRKEVRELRFLLEGEITND